MRPRVIPADDMMEQRTVAPNVSASMRPRVIPADDDALDEITKWADRLQ